MAQALVTRARRIDQCAWSCPDFCPENEPEIECGWQICSSIDNPFYEGLEVLLEAAAPASPCAADSNHAPHGLVCGLKPSHRLFSSALQTCTGPSPSTCATNDDCWNTPEGAEPDRCAPKDVYCKPACAVSPVRGAARP